MKNLLLFMSALILSASSYAQFTCHAVISAGVTGSTVTLTNNSTPATSTYVLTSYNIAWGDASSTNTYSNNPQTHTYTSPGTYSIRMVMNSVDSGKIQPQYCHDTALATVTITGLYTIAGNVWVDSTSQLDSYKVWLIVFDAQTNILSAVDSQNIAVMAGSGKYYFANKAAGSYRTKAARLYGPSSGMGYVPTYHDSALLWSNANVINHGSANSLNQDIYMRKGTITSGPGFVGGNVSQGANKGTANGIAGMNVLLLDANDNVITYAVTDANGDYSFPALPNANYKVHPEFLGFTTTPSTLSITNGQASFHSVNFERSLSMKTIVPVASGVNNINNAKLDFAVFPNPAKNMVTIHWASYSEKTATVTITDISGKKVLNTEVKMNGNSVINIDALHTGFYFLNVANDMGNSTQKLMVQ